MKTTFLLLAALLLAIAFNSDAGIITTYAGNGGQDYTGDGGPATNAAINSPWGLALDPAGNLYVADGLNPVVRRVDHATAIVTTYAGTGAVGNTGDGGPATNALFTQLTSLATDLAGNLYVCDEFDGRIRKVDHATGIITTVAGSGVIGYGGDGGPAIMAPLGFPQGVAVDVQGNIYIADTDSHIIRKVDAATGIINTFAGDHTHSGNTGDGGLASNARLNLPLRVAVDASGNVFILDTYPHGSIRRVDAQTGIITRVAGGGTGNGASGSATNADLETANDLVVDNLGGLYLGGMTNVWKVDLNLGTISIVAGGLTTGYAGDGGPATNALIDFVLGVAVAGSGDVFISDNSNARVRRIAPDTAPPYGVLVDLTAEPNFLNPMPEVQGTLSLATVNGRYSLVLPNGTNAAAGLTVTGTNGLTITGVAGTTALSLSGLTSYGGNLTLTGLNNLNAIDASTVMSVAGSFNIVGNGGANITLGSSTVGSLTVSTGSGSVNAGVVTSTGSGSVDVGGGTNRNGSVVVSTGSGSIDVGAVNTTNPVVSNGSGTVNVNGANNNVVVSTGRGSINVGSVSTTSPVVSTGSGSVNVNSISNSIVVSGTTGTISVGPVSNSVVVVGGTTGSINIGPVNNSIVVSGTTSDIAIGPVSNSVVVVAGTTGTISVGAPSSSVTVVSGGSGTVTVGNISNNGSTTVSGGSGTVSVGAPTNSVTVVSGGSGTVTVGNISNSGSTTVSGGSGTVSVGAPTNSVTIVSGGSGSVSVNGGVTTTGSLIVTNSGSGAVFVGSSTVGGNVSVTGSGTNSTTLTGSTVGGAINVSLSGGASADLSGTQTAGSVSVTTSGGSSFTASTGGSTTTVVVSNGPATLNALLPTNSFTTNVIFSVQAVAGTNTAAAAGTAPDGSLTGVTPVAQYQFAFAIPTLNRDATLTFDIALAALDPTNRAAFLTALNSGTATVAVQGDAPGSLWQAFPICGAGELPGTGGCVSLLLLDGAGVPLPPGSTNAPAVARFTGLAGHFSKWGVVLSQSVRVGTALLGGGTLRLTWPAVGTTILETSTNLAPNSWSPAGSPTQQPDGSWQLDVTRGEPARFYRLKGQ